MRHEGALGLLERHIGHHGQDHGNADRQRNRRAKDGVLVVCNAIDRERNHCLATQQKPLYCAVDEGVGDATDHRAAKNVCARQGGRGGGDRRGLGGCHLPHHLPKRRTTLPPPCTWITWPLTQPLAGEHSHSMALARSSGWPVRPVRLSGCISFCCTAASTPASA